MIVLDSDCIIYNGISCFQWYISAMDIGILAIVTNHSSIGNEVFLSKVLILFMLAEVYRQLRVKVALIVYQMKGIYQGFYFRTRHIHLAVGRQHIGGCKVGKRPVGNRAA